MDRSVNIRLVAPTDNPALSFIIKDVLGSFGGNKEGFASQDPETDAMYEAYQADRHVYYVAEVNGKVVGGAGIAPLKDAPPEVCELQKMYILEEGRGLGIATELMELCLKDAREMGYQQCYLETLVGMDVARGMYERRGFQLLDEPLGGTGHFGCNTWMIRDL